MEESLNENNSNLITSSAADSIQAAEYFSNLVANLQQFTDCKSK